ncbi:thioredoxin family protein [Oculatella sp. LEGE 06141]|uniref:thioredoxin family protein n=1 Tax=Oculatella sp. LEGE 06141 TaxID=1828648 RepID=UPI0018800441|nr:thioredoxin family protein [Oculatella sp. LEGE 06141]MBE9182819.1 thioredoxin family protein [Oculatella sp. LEGE 06141]
MNTTLLRRRQLLLSLGLGVAGAVAAIAHHHSRDTSGQSTAPDGVAVTGASSLLSRQGEMPEFQGISQWLNSPPLTVAGLKGNAILVQFWTFACINCQRTLPHVTRWHQQYAAQGLTIVGVHTPEFAFEREVNNIQTALEQHHITYPVPIDNEFKTWKAYNNRFWPHLFLADRDGVVRYDHIGEGAYDETEQAIRQLLS